MPLHTHGFSHYQYPLPERHAVTTDEPPMTYYNSPQPTVYFTVTLGVAHTRGLDKGRIHVSIIMVY